MNQNLDTIDNFNFNDCKNNSDVIYKIFQMNNFETTIQNTKNILEKNGFENIHSFESILNKFKKYNILEKVGEVPTVSKNGKKIHTPLYKMNNQFPIPSSRKKSNFVYSCLKNIFSQNHWRISKQNLMKILKNSNIDNLNSLSTGLSFLKNKGIVKIVGYENFKDKLERNRISPIYEWVDTPIRSNESKPSKAEEAIQNSSSHIHNHNNEENIVDVYLENMRRGLVEKFVPLVKSQKELQNVKKELCEVLDENKKLLIEIKIKNNIIEEFKKKVNEQCQKVISDIASYFGVHEEKIIDILF
jgi:D-ribose pyranose/furanose isomerase RbsD